MFENDITISGKHATYVKFLVNEAKVFNRYIDVYMNGAILGFLYGRKSTKDSGSTDRARIYADALANERMKCDFIYRLIMLLDESNQLSVEERVDKAFRDDAKENSENHKSNMKLFNDYVFGGIEVLYETYTNDCTTNEDYINKIYEVVTNFKEELDGNNYNDRIEEVIADYF